MLILNAEPLNYNDEARELLMCIGILHEEECDREKLLSIIPNVNVLIVRLGHRIDEEVLTKGEKLKVIVTATTGLNHIDLSAAENLGIQVLSLKGEQKFLRDITATAELSWALLLAVVRRIPVANNHVHNGLWERNFFKNTELQNKTLGLVGFGRLGRIVAEYGKAFRMKVMAYDPYVESVPEWVKKVDLEELLVRSEVVSLHVNLNEKTQGFFGKEQFSSMKKGAVFINTSRGELVEENELLFALESGHISGAGLDVLSGESTKERGWIRSNVIWQYAQKHDNVILTPHIGGATVESMAKTELFMAEKLKNYIASSSVE